MNSLAPLTPAGNPIPLSLTYFERNNQPAGQRNTTTWADLCDWIERNTLTAASKSDLPLIKLATFAGNYRTDANLETVYGIEGDYDAGQMPPDSAAALLIAKGVQAFIYTSPSHRPDKPRWRVLCPLSQAHPPNDRHALVGRLNGLLGGILAPESFTPSQAFYVGSVLGGYPVQFLRTEGRPLDTVEGLQSIGPATTERTDGRQFKPGEGRRAPSYQTALDALRSVHPSDIERSAWLSMSGAFFIATRGLPGSENAERDWQTWNEQHGDKNKPDENARTWGDFQRNGADHDFTTLGRMSANDNARGWAFFNGVVHQLPSQSSRSPIEFFPASDLSGPPPSREWLVPDLIPNGTVTLLGGDGGTGKSLLALQLAVAVTTRRFWINRLPMAGPALVISAEDDKAELHRRLADIARAENITLDDLRQLTLASLAGDNALLATLTKSGVLDVSPLYHALDAKIAEQRPKLVILDTLADLYPGNENDRAQARQFIGLLRGIAIRHQCAVVLLAHPSLSGLATGTGTSGSTGWNNSVRSRLYFERIKDDDYEPNVDARRLRVMKSNYGRVGNEIDLTFRNGVFVADHVDASDTNAKAERVFLKLLEQFTAQGRDTNPSSGPNYAPTVFANHPDAEGCSKRSIKDAMERLLLDGKIAVRTKKESGHDKRYLAVIS
ncbi:RecA-family ATPase (modular protein) [Mesorhizobium metallidurans STM 2683]|uniref:RecA-family ATPase (Modular protein) n=1 Tax=Mesorhizobium metallidurans STM 2683 TaxID=1297569 RepID=M5EPM4_9HYPH|nr:AAA family ATPase [Mesorhizobium metallidurans]CCV06704.1 RecA-family ATPase (modular protein) [Mesorhizobium metallidurans STM 2683]